MSKLHIRLTMYIVTSSVAEMNTS